MLPGNGGIPFRTTDLGFCSDSSEVIFTIPLLAPVSHHHRLALPFCGKVTLFVNAFLIYRYYISHFFALSSRIWHFFSLFSCVIAFKFKPFLPTLSSLLPLYSPSGNKELLLWLFLRYLADL